MIIDMLAPGEGLVADIANRRSRSIVYFNAVRCIDRGIGIDVSRDV